MEQLDYERRIEEKRLRTEITYAKRKAEHFASQVEKGERLRQLEEKVIYLGLNPIKNSIFELVYYFYMIYVRLV